MTTLEIAVYGVVGVVSVVLAVLSLNRQRRRPEPVKGLVLLSFTSAVLFLFILTRAWSADDLGSDRFFFAAFAAGLFSTTAALFACCARVARRVQRERDGGPAEGRR